jgi:hypothetical protein
MIGSVTFALTIVNGNAMTQNLTFMKRRKSGVNGNCCFLHHIELKYLLANLKLRRLSGRLSRERCFLPQN